MKYCDDGFILEPGKVSFISWNEEAEAHIKREVPFEEVPFYSWNGIAEIHPEYTFRHFMELIKASPKAWQLLTGSNVNITDFIEEAFSPVEEDLDHDMDYLEVYLRASIDKLKGMTEGNLEDSFVFYSGYDFHGWGDQKNPLTKEPFKGGFALELSPINELLDYPLTFRSTSEVEVEDSIYVCIKEVISLVEFARAIFQEMSFFGSLDKRKEVQELLMDAVKSLKSE